MSILDKDIEVIDIFECNAWLLDEYERWPYRSEFQFLSTAVLTKNEACVAAIKLVSLSKRRVIGFRLKEWNDPVFKFYLTLR